MSPSTKQLPPISASNDSHRHRSPADKRNIECLWLRRVAKKRRERERERGGRDRILAGWNSRWRRGSSPGRGTGSTSWLIEIASPLLTTQLERKRKRERERERDLVHHLPSFSPFAPLHDLATLLFFRQDTAIECPRENLLRLALRDGAPLLSLDYFTILH